jgi:iron complex outermembrane receptor protein
MEANLCPAQQGLNRRSPRPWIAIVVLAVVTVLGALPALRAQDKTPTPPAAPSTGEKAKAQEQEKKEQPTPIEEELQKISAEITVTGTRVEGRSATDTPAPVDYIDSGTIRSTQAVETGKILQLLDPSFNFSTTTISDGTDIVRPATLRSLGADQVLVLVNGKRRHQQALLNVQQTVARGSAGYDINAIPASAIDHIEVLRDGAAAQYGSDAIAGVINIILKDQSDAADVALEGGQYYKGDGRMVMAGVNKGFKLGGDGFLNFTVEYRDRGETNRAGADSLRVNPPRVTQRIGDAESKDSAIWFNAGIPAGPGRFYAFGGWSQRKGDSSGFFRSAGDGRTIPAIYPNGFLPNIITKPVDTSAVVGYKGDLSSDWKYDLSANYGNSKFQFREENTANVSWFFEPIDPNNPTGPRFNSTPISADTGTLQFNQLSFDANLTGTVKWGVGAGPLNLAAGAEWRQEGYKIEAGDPVSYLYGRTNNRSIRILDQTGSIAQPGTQGFPGWSPAEAVDKSRSNLAVYLDTESQLTSTFLAGAAVRYEDYSDFGSTVTGKLSGRLNLSDRFALRSTVSTGFRAPSVQQEFYSQRSTNLNAAGILTDTLTARQDSAVARALGVPALKEETSRNYSIGLVSKPTDAFRLTVDLYRIDIKDRIIFSSNIQPEDLGGCGSPFDPAKCPIRAILDPLGVGQLLLFTNAVDTRTKGLDVVALYDWRLGVESLLSLEGAFDFNHTDVTKRKSPSKILPPEVLFDKSQVTLVEEGQPGRHYVLSGTYFHGPWNSNLRFNYFGPVAGEGFTPGFKQTWGGKWLTDLSITYSLSRKLSLTVGGLNIFNVYPDKWDEQKAFPFPQLGFVYGWETLPFGMNGGFYSARFNYKL